MKGKLKDWPRILSECPYYKHTDGSHYWVFFYNFDGRDFDGRAKKLGFRDFYYAYMNTEVTVRPKFDRKKRVMTDRVEVLSKKGKYIFTAMKCWFVYFSDDKPWGSTSYYEPGYESIPDPFYADEYKEKVEKVDLSNVSWDELFIL